MKAAKGPGRGGVYWTFVGAMALSVLGAALSLIGGVDGDVRAIGLWVVMVCSLGALFVLAFAPGRLQGRSRDG